MIKAIIFDYDGVLVDSVNAGLKAYRHISEFLKIKKMKTLEEFRTAQRNGYHSLLDDWGVTDPAIREQTKKIYREKNKELKETIKLVPRMKDILEQLSKRYTLAIASGTYKELITERINNLGIQQYFKCIISNDDVAHNKPAPDILLRVLEKLKIKPEEAVYIGDMAYDIMAGKAAKVRTIAIASKFGWNTRKNLEEQYPDMLIENHEDLLRVI